jgi:hypothetical protein
VVEKTNKASRYKLGVIICLVLSVFWIFMGLDIGFKFEAVDLVSRLLTLGGLRHTIMSVCGLVLIVVCSTSKHRIGFLGTLVLGVMTLTLTAAHIIYMFAVDPSGFIAQLFGPLVWSLIQIPLIIFSFKAYRIEMQMEVINV